VNRRFGGSMLLHHRQVAGTLAVEAKVLGERLAGEELKATLHKVPHGPGIAIRIATGKALVGGIKEREELLLFKQISQFDPLLLGGVDTGGIVGTGVQDDHSTGWGLVQIGHHVLEVQLALVLVPVAVRLQGREAHIGEDLVVVLPCGIRVVNHVAVQLSVQEISGNTQGSCARDGLHSKGLKG